MNWLHHDNLLLPSFGLNHYQTSAIGFLLLVESLESQNAESRMDWIEDMESGHESTTGMMEHTRRGTNETGHHTPITKVGLARCSCAERHLM